MTMITIIMVHLNVNYGNIPSNVTKAEDQKWGNYDGTEKYLTFALLFRLVLKLWQTCFSDQAAWLLTWWQIGRESVQNAKIFLRR